MTINKQHIRRIAMQVLYRIDQSGETDAEALLAGLDDEDEETGKAVSMAARVRGVELALGAWAQRGAADALASQVAPDWPTHRQPPVDRAILRLAYQEMTTGHAPVKVAINEAILLAKRFGSEQSPMFVNGVLDKLAKHLPPSIQPADPDADTDTEG